MLGNAVIQFAFQIYIYVTIKKTLGNEYVYCEASGKVGVNDSACSKNTAMYLFTCTQYLTCCLCFSISKPFRKPTYTNPLFLVSVILMGVYQTYALVFSESHIEEAFGLVRLPQEYKYFLGILFVANSILSYAFEKCFIGWYNKYYTRR